MRVSVITVLALAALAGCGPKAPGAAGQGGAANVCGAVTDAAAVFGRAVDGVADPGFGTIAGGCRWSSADGVVIGEAALFTPQSIGGDPDAKTPQAMYDKLAAALDPLTDTPLEPVADLGEHAARALDTAGEQTQIVFIKGDQVFLVRAASADPKLAGPALAEKLARALAPKG